MWISRAACFWMASTTRGWQCPVATTAIPALKSRKRLPSTSWTMAPAALSTTIGYPRVYEDDTARASRSMIGLARGPGIGPERWGRSMRTGSKFLFMWRLLLCSLLVERLKTCTPYRRAPLVADGNLVGPEQPRAGCGGRALHGYILIPLRFSGADPLVPLVGGHYEASARDPITLSQTPARRSCPHCGAAGPAKKLRQSARA